MKNGGGCLVFDKEDHIGNRTHFCCNGQWSRYVKGQREGKMGVGEY